MTPHEITHYLDSFVNWETRSLADPPALFKLERIRRLLDLIGNPQDTFKVIHVAGSKGKGSTCVFIAHILQSAGYKIGLYTSPHLKDCRERIRIVEPPGLKSAAPSLKQKLFHNPYPRTLSPEILRKGLSADSVGQEEGAIFSDAIRWDTLARAIEDLRPAIERMRADASLGRLTFFEVYTALALYHFHQEKVDFAVLETGLGGRLDATNAASSLVCAITPISLEHTEILGSSLRQIAAEKAGIIKDCRQRVVLAPQERGPMDVLRRRCEEFSIDPILVGRDILYALQGMDEHGSIVHLKGQRGDYPDLRVSLLGEHQVVNAATALGIVECLQESGVSIGREAISHGLRQAFWPGRFEVLLKGRQVILDGAHNKASALCLKEGVKKFFPGRRVVLVLGVSNDKDRKGIAEALAGLPAEAVVATKADHPRAHDFDDGELKEMFPGTECLRSRGIRQALALAYERTGPEDIVLVTGSLFLVAQVRDLINVSSI